MRRTTVAFNGQIKSGVELEIKEAIERWCEIRLEDGASILFRHTPTQVIRLDEADPQGNPMYIVMSTALLRGVDLPDGWNDTIRKFTERASDDGERE